MSRKVHEEAPVFTRKLGHEVEQTYNVELITPIAGGGVESWKPDKNNPFRTQEIKGQLRFWWRTMQSVTTAQDLKKKEDDLWGRTENASKVRLSVVSNKIDDGDFLTIPRNGNYLDFKEAKVPGYVLFPLQHEDDPCRLLAKGSFTLTVQCPETEKETVENTLKLWILFGGLGARTTRGCGSLYSPQVMNDFPDCQKIKDFIGSVSPETVPPYGTAPFPVLGNSRFGFTLGRENEEASSLWNDYLARYGDFRQGKTTAREPRKGPVPGQSLWPEPDAIRQITGKYRNHTPRHSDRWFPRTAYGLPILSRFNTNKDSTDPQGDFSLQPEETTRWPSPVILKVIKLTNGRAARIWLLLNHAIPAIKLTSTTYDLTSSTDPDYHIPAAETASAFAGKQLLHGRTLPATGTNPYDALIDHLNIPEVT